MMRRKGTSPSNSGGKVLIRGSGGFCFVRGDALGGCEVVARLGGEGMATVSSTLLAEISTAGPDWSMGLVLLLPVNLKACI